MKNLIITVAALLAATAATAQSLYARYERQLQTPRSYICHRTDGPIKIDGKLNEPAWQQAKLTEEFEDISGKGFAKPKYKTQARMLWDDDYLYVAAEIEEPNVTAYLTQRDTIIYHDNDFEVFVNPDGDAQQYFEMETNARGVLFDLMLNRPYRSGGDFYLQWDCPGVKLATQVIGKLNDNRKPDQGWTVEMAIPRKALSRSFDNPLQAGRTWRIGFSRVEWLKGRDVAPEDNWVWTATGKIDMHMPERWGYLYLADTKVGTPDNGTFPYPYNMEAYKLLWAMFYAQLDNHAKEHNYLRNVERFFLTERETAGLPKDAKIDVQATQDAFEVGITLPSEGRRMAVDQNGCFTVKEIAQREVANFVWTGHRKDGETPWTDAQWQHWFKVLKECCITGVMFEFYDEHVYKMAHEAGLQCHYWKWTMNRREVMDTHPDWFAVNRKGESCYDKPAYVDYYRFLCPRHPGVAEYLAADYVKEAHKPYVDGVHLDYVRFPDIVLPVSLWQNYGIEQTKELPEYDYCYCDLCRADFKQRYGIDPMDIKYPQENQSWLAYRWDGITQVVDAITRAVKADGSTISAAVFPGPSMARHMVRQDWGNWHLDAYYPMIYNAFYYEGTEWIGRSVKESVTTVNGKAKIYAGLMFGDIKADFNKALDEAYGNGASGVSFFDGPDEEYLHKFAEYIKAKGYVVK